MPDMPDVMDELEIELPPAAEMALREGEERFRAGLTLEDRRRKDALIEEMRTQLKKLEGMAEGVIANKFASSPTARRRQIAQRKLTERLQKETFRRGDRWEGPCVPATVINLNPVPLTLQGELQRWTVPSAGNGLKVTLTFRGRKFVGSYLTIVTPHSWPSHTGTRNDKQSGVDMPDVDYKYIPPLGIAHQFYEHFVEGAADAQGIGGVLVFEGDIHTLTRALKTGHDAILWVPKKEITLEGYGDEIYTVEEQMLEGCIEKSVITQRDYASMQIAEGHSYATAQSDIIRNQLSNYHRLWHNYALGKGYIEKALPWATEQLKDTPATQAVHCPDCHTRQASPEQYFCIECNSPFDALKAYLAGKVVSPDRLAVYEGEEWDLIVAEKRRRDAKIATLNLPGEAPKVPLTKEERKAMAKAAAEARKEK